LNKGGCKTGEVRKNRRDKPSNEGRGISAPTKEKKKKAWSPITRKKIITKKIGVPSKEREEEKGKNRAKKHNN